MTKKLFVLSVVLALFALAPVASAEPFGVTFNGGLFTLEQLACPSCGSNQYLVRYAADLTAFSAPNYDFITAVGFKVGVDPTAVALSAVGMDGSTFTSGAYFNYWTTSFDQWMSGSAYGCEGSQANSAVCGQANPFNVAPTTGHTYYWDFRLMLPEAPSSLLGQPIRAQFAGTDGTYNGRLMSLTTMQVPEPVSLLLLGTGLLGIGLLRRRR